MSIIYIYISIVFLWSFYFCGWPFRHRIFFSLGMFPSFLGIGPKSEKMAVGGELYSRLLGWTVGCFPRASPHIWDSDFFWLVPNGRVKYHVADIAATEQFILNHFSTCESHPHLQMWPLDAHILQQLFSSLRSLQQWDLCWSRCRRSYAADAAGGGIFACTPCDLVAVGFHCSVPKHPGIFKKQQQKDDVLKKKNQQNMKHIATKIKIQKKRPTIPTKRLLSQPGGPSRLEVGSPSWKTKWCGKLQGDREQLVALSFFHETHDTDFWIDFLYPWLFLKIDGGIVQWMFHHSRTISHLDHLFLGWVLKRLVLRSLTVYQPRLACSHQAKWAEKGKPRETTKKCTVNCKRFTSILVRFIFNDSNRFTGYFATVSESDGTYDRKNQANHAISYLLSDQTRSIDVIFASMILLVTSLYPHPNV